MTSRKLSSQDPLTQLLISRNILSWKDLVAHVSALPYGRNDNKSQLDLVITQGKGSCSTKHALLKRVAQLNGFTQIKLILGLYKMTEDNTPGIAPILSDHNVSFIPEAHCYLMIDGKRKDYTSLSSNIELLMPAIIEEQEIKPIQITDYKVDYHRRSLLRHLASNEATYSLDQFWSIREACIAQLEATKT